MKIGCAFDTDGAAMYRGLYPLETLERRGHEVVWPENGTGNPRVHALTRCDVVFVYRRYEEALRTMLERLSTQGIGVVWDNDDDFSAIPKHSPTYRELGALRAQKRFSETVRMAKTAHVVTLTTDTLRERYAAAGIRRVEVIDNMLRSGTKRRPRKHDGLVIGWIAGMEHMADAHELDVAGALEQVQRAHSDVRVTCVGVDLKLKSGYDHRPGVPFVQLPGVMANFDIGLAPLTDIPFNRARSSIKVKEYAASQVPWLASPVTPYAHLGPEQGGLLVADGDWAAALDRLVSDRRARKRLARAGKRWAKAQTADAVADRWEAVLTEAIERARAGVTSASAGAA